MDEIRALLEARGRSGVGPHRCVRPGTGSPAVRTRKRCRHGSTPAADPVVDTVAAYFLLGTELRRALRAVLRLPAQRHRAGTWEVELANVIWLAVRSGVLKDSEGLARFRLARLLGIEPVPPSDLCQGALLRSSQTGVAVYDSLFVELAIRTGRRLATYDRALLRTFPDVAARPEALVSV